MDSHSLRAVVRARGTMLLFCLFATLAAAYPQTRQTAPIANGSTKAPVGSTTKVRHIRLGAAGVGIRGTDFEAEVAADGSGSIHLHSGELEISSVSGGAPFRMTAGQVVTFTSAGIFSSPEPSKKPTS